MQRTKFAWSATSSVVSNEDARIKKSNEGVYVSGFVVAMVAFASTKSVSSVEVKTSWLLSTFWDQVLKSSGVFIKSVPAESREEEHVTSVILTTFAKLVDEADGREDKDVFLKGRGFVTFCEYWMSFAKIVSASIRIL